MNNYFIFQSKYILKKYNIINFKKNFNNVKKFNKKRLSFIYNITLLSKI